MKKLFIISIALFGLVCQGQDMQSIVKQTVIIDSIQYNVDSVPRVFFRVERVIKDTLYRMSSTPAELMQSLKIAQERVRFTDQSVRAQVQFLKDSIKDNTAKNYVLQQVAKQNSAAQQYRVELDLLREIKKKFSEIKVIK